MRCPHCGAEVQGNFCEYCGSSLNVDNGTGAAGASPFESAPEEKPWKTEPPISPFEAESSGNETQQEAPEEAKEAEKTATVETAEPAQEKKPAQAKAQTRSTKRKSK